MGNLHVQEPQGPVEPQKTLGAQQMEEMAENGGLPGRAKGPKRAKVEKKAVVELPAIIDDKTPFVPPAAALKRWAPPPECLHYNLAYVVFIGPSKLMTAVVLSACESPCACRCCQQDLPLR